jgi:site-specific DNA-methyltransferase (adenine-specific)
MLGKNIEYVPVVSIKIGKRQRKDMGDIAALSESIMANGLLQPIGIDQDNNLIWGGRRLAAHILAAVPVVPARRVFNSDPQISHLLEYIENNDRKTLTPEEEDKALLELHAHKTKDNARLGVKKWTQTDTAELMKVSKQALNKKLSRAQAMAALPPAKRAEVYAGAGLNGNAVARAAGQLEKQNARSALLALEEASRPPEERARLDKIIRHGDALELIKAIPSDSIDVIITDPPYGAVETSMLSKQFKEGENAILFDDNAEKTAILLDAIIPELYRVARDGAHIYIFCSLIPKGFDITIPSLWSVGKRMMDVGFTVRPGALIWSKILGQGFAGAGTVWPFSHEAILFAKKGSRDGNEMWRGDVLQHAAIRGDAKKHKFHKPSSLISHLLDVSALKNGRFLDPFCGCGQTVVDAMNAGMSAVGFDASDEACETARQMVEARGEGEK